LIQVKRLPPRHLARPGPKSVNLRSGLRRDADLGLKPWDADDLIP